ncbi:long-chain fatty acid transport protein [Pseudoalteromonas sp. BSi20652]|uniref:OmpP1/FadL family transporter n=1 Tax=Pseudoalteromonas sp. BSi20652 TaxID=388384 RepID=UPI000231B574|nr:outer membrane protein transport protein [Pseudoalteromonas sp. BSi20652]GAA60290.1 long-chain fatty acid transport protein [Pseudoalteromonas sp. BSi20652]
MKKQLVSSLALTCALGSFSAFATNGYFTHGYGMTHKGMAGAGVALSEELMSGANNPANLLVDGTQFSLGLELFSPDRKYTASTVDNFFPNALYLEAKTQKSDNTLFTIPEFAIGHQLNEQVNIGLLVYGNGGMNTEYNAGTAPDGTFYAGTAGVDLKQLFISPTVSYQFNEQTRIGVSPIYVVQQFEAQGLSSFALFSQSPQDLSDNGTDTSTGVGIQLGINQTINSSLSWGASYRSAVSMQEFDSYRGLFAEQGGFDLPSSIQIGAAFKVTPNNEIVFDWQKINYGEVKSIANPINNLMSAPLGADGGAGFGWDDMTIYKLGYQWQRTVQQKIRFGISYTEQPIPSSEVLFNILAPGVQEWHFTTGFSHSFSNKVQLNAMAFYSPAKEVAGANFLAPNQALSIEMEQSGLGVSVVWGI